MLINVEIPNKKKKIGKSKFLTLRASNKRRKLRKLTSLRATGHGFGWVVGIMSAVWSVDGSLLQERGGPGAAGRSPHLYGPRLRGLESEVFLLCDIRVDLIVEVELLHISWLQSTFKVLVRVCQSVLYRNTT